MKEIPREFLPIEIQKARSLDDLFITDEQIKELGLDEINKPQLKPKKQYIKNLEKRYAIFYPYDHINKPKYGILDFTISTTRKETIEKFCKEYRMTWPEAINKEFMVKPIYLLDQLQFKILIDKLCEAK